MKMIRNFGRMAEVWEGFDAYERLEFRNPYIADPKDEAKARPGSVDTKQPRNRGCFDDPPNSSCCGERQ
jgi:hypothetical protein